MIKSPLSRAALALLALPLAFAAPVAQADPQSDLQRVEISGRQLPPLTRFDVRTACPGIDASIQEAMSQAWDRERTPGTVRMVFQMQGTTISQVRAQGGPREYSQPLRRAVRSLDCGQPGRTETETYAFLVSFSENGSAGNAGKVALLTLDR